MDKFQETFKQLSGKWSNHSKGRKSIIILITSSIVIAIILTAVFAGRVKYAVLFSGMDSKNTAKIIEKFDTDKVKYKVQGDKILVPEDQVDKLRISVSASDAVLPSHSGWELFDKTSQFGVTDTQSKVMYQRALSGEIAKAIETIQGIKIATVNLVIPEKSVFVTDSDKATAAVILKLNDDASLNPQQVKAIAALVSRSVENLPKENVEISDQFGNLLSEDASGDMVSIGINGTTKQMDLEKKFETNLQNDVKKLLESSFGKNKVQVKVNADLDFDSRQITTIKYDAAKVERSVQKKTQTTKDSTGSDSGSSPVDNNMTNTISNSSKNGSESSQTEETNNYEIPETREVIVAAPGEVKQLSISVLLNGNLSSDQIDIVKNIVTAATGFNQSRGDIVNIASIPFNTDDEKINNKVQQDLEIGNKTIELQKLYTLLAFGIVSLLFLISFMSTFKKRKQEEAFSEAFNMESGQIIDSIIGDKEEKNEKLSNNNIKIIKSEDEVYEPVLDREEPRMSLETEIKDYAIKKPEQVAEIIKTWLSEEER